jgi:type IV secretion system protein VirB4
MDEAWKLLDDDEFKRTMKDYFKTIRKRNGLVIFGTQSADDVVQSSVSRTIIEQTSTNIFFANPKADENSYMEHFGLSRAEFDWVKNGDPASRFMLIKQAKSSVIARVDMSHMPEFIKVLSGREETVREVEMLLDEYGNDPKTWLSKFCDWEGDATVGAVVLASMFTPVAAVAQVPVIDNARRNIQQATENCTRPISRIRKR